jgi:N-acetylmuramoyl-L-alanine amidase
MMLVHRAGEALLATGLSILLVTTWTAAADAAAPAKRSAAASCDRAQFRVVVDVGHTAQSPGAASARGVDEFDFNLRLAKEINRKLLDMGFARTVLLVTKGPSRKGLMERVARANEAKPDVFLSIHHDSVPDRMMEKWEFEGVKRPFNDKYPGHSIFISADNPEYQASLLFATIIGKELKARGMRYTPHYTDPIMGSRQRLLVDTDAGVYRYDQLIVLRQTRMPAVLLEAGSIVNRNDELVLAGADRQRLVAAAVGDAADRYCQLHPPRTTAPEAKQQHHEGGPQVIPAAATMERRSRAFTSQ